MTGTNGKTTVTALTGQLVSRAGKTVAVAGNIGPTLLDTLADRLAQDTLPEVWVLELSSFQLDAVQGFEPTAATVLNITQDHLDWHGTMPAYLQAKANVFGLHGLRLLNRNDPLVLAMRGTDAPVPAVKSRQRHSAPRPFVTFGADLPQRPGDFGMELVNGMVWLVRALEAEDTGKKRKRSNAGSPHDASAHLEAVPVEAELQFQRLMPADALRIRGRHNAVNALAALALASAAGCSLAPMLYGLREYRGEPHRLESIGIFNEVEYFDDSKGTNVGATVAALHGLGPERKLLVILGGDGKGQDFAPLADPVSRYARAVLLIGRDAPLLRAALAGTGVPLIEVASMTDAVTQASAIAQGGDAVLLSPACASFDMFDNYQQRGQVFVAALRDCAHAAGVELEGAL